MVHRPWHGSHQLCDVLTSLSSQLQAGLIPRIFQYLWRRMPEVQASMLSHCAASMAASEAEHDSSIKSSEPSLTWLVRCSMLEIHRCVRAKHARPADDTSSVDALSGSGCHPLTSGSFLRPSYQAHHLQCL